MNANSLSIKNSNTGKLLDIVKGDLAPIVLAFTVLASGFAPAFAGVGVGTSDLVEERPEHAQVGSYLASQATDNVHLQRAGTAFGAATGTTAGAWAGGKAGAAVGSVGGPAGAAVGGILGAAAGAL